MHHPSLPSNAQPARVPAEGWPELNRISRPTTAFDISTFTAEVMETVCCHLDTNNRITGDTVCVTLHKQQCGTAQPAHASLLHPAAAPGTVAQHPKLLPAIAVAMMLLCRKIPVIAAAAQRTAAPAGPAVQRMAAAVAEVTAAAAALLLCLLQLQHLGAQHSTTQHTHCQTMYFAQMHR
jgi:hypothetical protein